MQRPPTIMPNYGKKPEKLGVPKTSLSRVLLYDNITQQQMLDVKIANIKIEKIRAEQLFNTHKRLFSVHVKKLNQSRRQNEKRKRDAQNKIMTKLPSITSQGTIPQSPVLRRVSTFSVTDVQLPQIGHHNKQIVLKLKTKSGRSKLYHSYDDSNMFVDVVPLFKFYPDVKEDPRFQNLETTLIYPEVEDSVGYAALSPSYVKPLPKIPEYLQDHENPEK